MKKLIAIAVVFALVAGVAFAQNADGISIQAWGRAGFSPLKYVTAPQNSEGTVKKGEDGKDLKPETYSGVGASWGGDKPRVDFRVNGSSEFVGFNTQFEGEGGLGIADNLHIWAKPFGSDILKLTAGKIADDTLRGKIGNLNGGFENFVLFDPDEEDAIFNRFSTWAGVNKNSDYGWMISSAPMDGLYIGLVVSGGLDPKWNKGYEGGTPIANVFRYMQLGAGYNIPNIGHIRAQYIGGWAGEIDLKDEDTMRYFKAPGLNDDGEYDLFDAGKRSRIEVAFALTAVEGLLIDVGAKIGMELKFKDYDNSITDGLAVSVGANYNSGSFGLGARVDAKGLGAHNRGSKDDKSEDGMTMVIRVVPTFALDAATLGLDVAFKLVGESKAINGDGGKDAYSQIGFGAFVSKGLGKGSVKAGLSLTLAPSYSNGDTGKGMFGQTMFQIPVLLEYAFF